MLKPLRRIAMTFALLMSLLALLGCAASATGMRPQTAASYTPREGMATVIFLRDSRLGSKINFPIVDQRRAFIGNVRGGQHAIAQVPAGQHTFYVIAENVEPLRATLEAGRTYLIVTRPRMGWGKARVTVQPVSAASFAALREQLSETTAMVPDEASAGSWLEQNRSSVEGRIAAAEKAWSEADAAWRKSHTLALEDGVLDSGL
jgi:hypothetical protein